MTDNNAFEGPTTEIFTTSTTLDNPKIDPSDSPEKEPKTKNDRRRMALAIVGFVVSVAIITIGAVWGALAKKNKGGGDEVTYPSYRLPDTLRPIEYQVRLQPFINGNYSIHGYVEVEMSVVQATKNITIHLADIVTHNETVQVRSYSPEEGVGEGSGKKVEIAKHEYDPEKEWYVAHLGKELQVDHRVVISMSFTGLLNDNLKGFYRSSYTTPEGDDVRLAVTFFSPINARRAFPCLDEPAMKARFKVSLARETNMTALANMPLKETEPIPDQEGWVWDHFQTTLPMSTYLVAFMVSDFDHESSGNISVWSRSEVLEEAHHSLQISPQLLGFFEGYLNVTYPLPKMDIVALPDFAAGAMENWGLLTFKEEKMLLPEAPSAAARQSVEVVMAHELAHQWFGNLVTAAWWTDILLKEGMASYMENIGTHGLEPDWGILEQMVLTMQAIMVSDGLTSTHPVYQPVSRPSDIGQVFDSITYSKGMSVIRMMSHFLTEDTFRRGLTNYLNHFAYSVATQDDFWAIMTQVAHEDNRLPTSVNVKNIMDTWTLQAGYPVVTVTRSEDGHTATLTQERFLLTGNVTEEEANRWWLPLSYTAADAPDFNKTQPNTWMPASQTSMVLEHLPAKSDWIFLNLQGTGYFRVNYDQDNWARLTDQMLSDHTTIEVTSRSQLLDDALNLARAGRLNYETVLGLNAYLDAEDEYVPWSTALSGLSYLEKMLTRTGSYGNLRRYLLKLLMPLYNDVGFQDDLNDPFLEQRKRSLAVSWACKLGHEECVTKAVEKFDLWLANNTEVSPNIKSTVYCMGVAEGGQDAWEGVWARYLETEVAQEKIHLLKALGCSRELWILSQYLEMGFTEGSGIRKQDANRVFSSVAGNDVGRSMAWLFLRNEWDRIVNYYDTFSSVADLITSATAEFNTHIEKHELEVFAEEHEESLSTSSRAVNNALQNAEGNIAWMENNYEVIAKWLEENMEEEDEEEEEEEAVIV